MSKKYFFRCFISISLFSALFLLILFFSNLFLKRYDSYQKFNPYFKEKNKDYDIYFLGASNVLNGVFPMELWKNYGFTSYNLAWHGNTLAVDYWQLRLSSNIHKPKVAFIDILGLQNDMKVNDAQSYVHGILDFFPISEEKINAVKDLFETNARRTEYIFPFYLYHNSWRETNAKQIRKECFPTKGADFRIGVTLPETFDLKEKEYEGKETVSMEYGRKIISYCRENDIIPVFMLVPYPTENNSYQWKNAFMEILKSENVDFLDMSGIVDFETDQFDRFAHLNPSGARKVTEFIGKYLKNLNLESKGDSTKAKWALDYAEYRKFYDSKIKEQTNLKNLLVLLDPKNYRAEIYLSEKAQLSKTEQKLISQLGENAELFNLEEKNTDILVKVFSRDENSFSKTDSTVPSDFFITEKKYKSSLVTLQ